jgi:hypothetical protein
VNSLTDTGTGSGLTVYRRCIVGRDRAGFFVKKLLGFRAAFG